MEDLLTRLEAADPSDAPDMADQLTAALAATLDDRSAERSSDHDQADEPEPGSGR